jgi:hypothetical protein
MPHEVFSPRSAYGSPFGPLHNSPCMWQQLAPRAHRAKACTLKTSAECLQSATRFNLLKLQTNAY